MPAIMYSIWKTEIGKERTQTMISKGLRNLVRESFMESVPRPRETQSPWEACFMCRNAKIGCWQGEFPEEIMLGLNLLGQASF